MTHPRAGQPAGPEDLIDVSHLVTTYFAVRPDPEDPASRSRSARPGTAARAWTPRSTRRTSWPPPRRSASTARARATTARCSSAATRTASPSRPGSARSRSSSPTTSPCSSTPRTGSRRPRPCRTRSCDPTAAARRAPAWPTASWSRRRTTRPATAGSSTTRRTAARPTPTPPAWIADRANELLRADLAGVKRIPYARARGIAEAYDFMRHLRRRPAGRARPRRHPRGRDPDRRRPARRRERRLLGGDRRAAQPRPHGREPAGRPDLAVHDARLGRQDPDGLLVGVRDGVVDLSARTSTRSRPATTPTPTGTASSRPTAA